MNSKFLISANDAAGFWRCGHFFTQKGILVGADDFTEREWERLYAEPKLRIKKAGNAADDASNERIAAITDAIKTLQAEDFQTDGKPKVAALTELLSGDWGKIKPAERDQAWDALQKDGVKSPSDAT